MKKTAWVIMILLMGSFHSSGQKFGVEVSGGLSLSTSPELIQTGISTSDGHNISGTDKIEKIQFGSGAIGKLNFRYNLPKNMFIQTGVRMLSGQKDILVYSDYMSIPGQTAFRNKQTSLKYNFIDADLILGLKYSLNDRISMNIGAGPLILSSGKIIESTKEHNAFYSESFTDIENTQIELETKTRVNTGAIGFIGISYALNSKFDIALSSTIRIASWIPAQSELKKFEINGQDQLRNMNESQRKWNYLNEINVESVDGQAIANNDRIQYYIPNNQIDLTLGLRYNFGGLVDEKKDSLHSNNKNLFIDYALGFGIGMARRPFYENDFYTRIISSENSIYSIEKTKVKPFSYGSGINGRISGGVYLNEYLALQFSELFNFTYFTLNNKKLTDYEGSSELLEEEIVYSGQLFRSLMGVQVEYPFSRISPYVKTGISIGYGGNTKWQYTSDLTYYSDFEGTFRDHSEVILKNYGGASLGAYVGLGASLKMNENLHLFAEGLAISQNFSPTKGSLLKAEHNGVNLLPGLSKSETEIEYYDQLDYSGTSQNPYIPDKKLRFSEPFSSIMIQVGVRYSFPWF